MKVIVHWTDGDMGEFPEVKHYGIENGLLVMEDADGEFNVVCIRNTYQITVTDNVR